MSSDLNKAVKTFRSNLAKVKAHFLHDNRRENDEYVFCTVCDDR